MSGLDSILTQIIDDAKAAASTRIAHAEEEAHLILIRKQEECALEASGMIAAEKVSLELYGKESFLRRVRIEEATSEERVALIDEVLLKRVRARLPFCPGKRAND